MSLVPAGEASAKGSLFVIPSPLSEPVPFDSFAPEVRRIVDGIAHFVVENEKTARKFLKVLGVSRPIASLHFSVLDEHTKKESLVEMLNPALSGSDMGIISEAGCPCVADPGSDLVLLAHREGIRVRPLVGPSSILLALMASGLNGQGFVFHGYLPVDGPERASFIKRIEKESRDRRQTQIFMDTPYRTGRLFDEVLRTCGGDTLFCLARNLTGEAESIQTRKIKEWRGAPPNAGKEPAMFLLLAG